MNFVPHRRDKGLVPLAVCRNKVFNPVLSLAALDLSGLYEPAHGLFCAGSCDLSERETGFYVASETFHLLHGRNAMWRRRDDQPRRRGSVRPNRARPRKAPGCPG